MIADGEKMADGLVWSDVNTENLIDAVRKRPILYDTKHKEFKRDDIKSNDFNEIGALIGVEGGLLK